ncbi:MAG: cytidine deaminase [Clostridia bacterium]|nr:cytidine deaminase [Clostridia bacterium]
MFDLDKLVQIAKTAYSNSYSPHSGYKVGCALLTKNGKIFSGCNVENNGIMSICAERVAFTKAISDGERDFEALLVLGGKNSFIYTSPCGYCRQFISEFCSKDFPIYMYYDDRKDS